MVLDYEPTAQEIHRQWGKKTDRKIPWKKDKKSPSGTGAGDKKKKNMLICKKL